MAYVKNAADKDQVRRAQKKEQSDHERRLNDLRYVLNDRRGRRFLWKTMSDCGIFQTSFSSSTNVTFFNEGQRNVGLKILSDLNEAAPEVYVLMCEEEKKEREKQDG